MKTEETNLKKPLGIFRGDKVLWRLVLIFALISMVFVYSSASQLAHMRHTSAFSIMTGQMRYVILGFALILITHWLPLSFYRNGAYLFYGVGLILLALTLVAGETRNEGTRWLSIGGHSFQTSEFAKVALVVFVARALEFFTMEKFSHFLLKFYLPVGLYIGLIIWAGFSTGLIISFTVLVMLFVSKVKRSHIWRAVGITAGIFLLALFVNHFAHFNTRLTTVESRITSYAGTVTNDQEEQDQVRHSKIAIASGGILGKFPGNGTQRTRLPLSHSDYIYSIIVEESGLIGAAIVLLLYLCLFYRVIILGRACTKVFTQVMVTGLGTLIVTQAFVHILVNVAIFPVTGQTLPLISAGGSSCLAMSIAFGLMLSVSRTLNKQEQLEGNREE